MKKILTILSPAVIALGISLTPAAVSAATCSISNTGAGSTNTCTYTSSNVVTITCTNGVQIVNNNPQTAVSGTVAVNGNTISGTATSGNATNISALAVDLELNCAAAPAVVTPPPAVVSTPPAGGVGGGGAVQSVATTKVAALPNTGPADVIAPVAISALGLGVLVAGSRLAVGAYRRFALKQL